MYEGEIVHRIWEQSGSEAKALLEPFDLNGKLILADKGYDSDQFVRWLEEEGGIVVIPSRITAKHLRKKTGTRTKSVI